MEKTATKRHTKTKEAIHKAFVKMICERRSDEINVKSLTDLAGIHRKTFYLHYTCIEALYEDELNQLSFAYDREVEKLPVPYNYYELTKILFEFYTRSEFAELLYCDPQFYEFSGRLQQISLKHNRERMNPYAAYPQEMQNIINAFVANASTMAFRQWVADGKVVPMEEAVLVISKLLENGVSALMKT